MGWMKILILTILVTNAAVIMIQLQTLLPSHTTMVQMAYAQLPADPFSISSTATSTTTATTTEDTVVYQMYTEPRWGIFNILIPQGWVANGIADVPQGALQVSFEAISPDETKQVFFNLPQARYFYPSYGMEGGNLYYYRTSDQYVQEILIPELSQGLIPDLQLIDQTILAADYGASGGVYVFSFSKNGEPYIMQAVIATYGLPDPSGLIPVWAADSRGIVAPMDEFNQFMQVGWNSLLSMDPNEMVIQQYIAGAGGQAEAISGLTEEFLTAIKTTPSGSDAIGDFSSAILGTHQAMDELGSTYTLPNSHSYWWRDSSTGLFYGNNSGENPLPGGNLASLQPTNQ
jgi:hypothetical protein